jgi:(2Fe-2S) ferredoxin
METTSYFKHHVFFCLNQREDPRECCANHQAQEAFKHCKAKVEENNLSGAGVVRINQPGCLDRCAGGPVMVVYPEAVWYTYVDHSDIDEIIESHLMNGKVVERLRLPDDVGH